MVIPQEMFTKNQKRMNITKTRNAWQSPPWLTCFVLLAPPGEYDWMIRQFVP